MNYNNKYARKRIASFFTRSRTNIATYKKTAKVVKSVLNSQAETKSVCFDTPAASPLDGEVYVSNMAAAIGQNVTSEGRLGEKVHLQSATLRVKLSTSANPFPKQFRIAVIESRERLTANALAVTNVPTLTTFFRNSNRPPTQNPFDLHKVNVLLDRVIQFNPQLGTNDYQNKCLTLKVLFNKTITYDGETTGYLKAKNIYMLIWSYQDNGITIPVGMLCNTTLNFKDI